jgi:cytoskeletal protein CcmA (bactofilin family)
MDKSKQSGKQTLVEEGTELKGTLKSSCQVVVNGSIDGQIEAPSLTIADTGTVLGTVKAQKLRSEGTLAGNIDADDVYLSGVVRSNTVIRAKKLEVSLQPERGKLEVTFGECLLEVGEDPAHVQAEEPEAKTNRVDEPVQAVPARPSEGPSWSDPPAPAAPAPSPTAEAAPRESWPAGEGNGTGNGSANTSEGGRRKKGQDRRESQAPSS